MKTRLQQEQGSFLITAAIASGILAILMFAYLTYITNEYSLNNRSQGRTQALDLCESGLELGMAELNFPYQSNPSQAFTNANGWTSSGSGIYAKTVSNFTAIGGAGLGTVSVTVSNVGGANPQIQAVGTVTTA